MKDVAGVTDHMINHASYVRTSTSQQWDDNFLMKAAVNAETCHGEEKNLNLFVSTQEKSNFHSELEEVPILNTLDNVFDLSSTKSFSLKEAKKLKWAMNIIRTAVTADFIHNLPVT